MKILLERFKESLDYRKYKIVKYNVEEVMYLSFLVMLSRANAYKDTVKLRGRELLKL